MLTILSTPKAFTGLFAVIQRNAIESWTRSSRGPRSSSSATTGDGRDLRELGLRHVPDVATNAQGTPLLSDMFLTGQAMARNPVVCWANADIIFTSAIMRAAEVVAEHPRPAISSGGAPTSTSSTPLDFDAGWDEPSPARAGEGERKPANWIDYFMFTRGLFTELPPFASVGRATTPG